MVARLSEVPQKGSSVFSLFSLIKLRLASHPLASSYSSVTVLSVFCAQNIFFRPKCVGPRQEYGQAAMLVNIAGTSTCPLHTNSGKEAHINWSMVTCQGSTRSELP